jgi:hypothetical protein
MCSQCARRRKVSVTLSYQQELAHHKYNKLASDSAASEQPLDECTWLHRHQHMRLHSLDASAKCAKAKMPPCSCMGGCEDGDRDRQCMGGCEDGDRDRQCMGATHNASRCQNFCVSGIRRVSISPVNISDCYDVHVAPLDCRKWGPCASRWCAVHERDAVEQGGGQWHGPHHRKQS